MMPRCACGRARRRRATACQRCLDASAATARAKEPPTRWAADWRADGWFCIFPGGGRVVLARKINCRSIDLFSARATAIAGGAWSRAVDPFAAPWRMLSGSGELIELGPLLRSIADDCYCSEHFPAGCDFCQGMRLPDGAKEIHAR